MCFAVSNILIHNYSCPPCTSKIPLRTRKSRNTRRQRFGGYVDFRKRLAFLFVVLCFLKNSLVVVSCYFCLTHTFINICVYIYIYAIKHLDQLIIRSDTFIFFFWIAILKARKKFKFQQNYCNILLIRYKTEILRCKLALRCIYIYIYIYL